MKSVVALLASAAFLSSLASAAVTNRWSFNNAPSTATPGLTLADSISGAPATMAAGAVRLWYERGRRAGF